jgi:hypothetical protein
MAQRGRKIMVTHKLQIRKERERESKRTNNTFKAIICRTLNHELISYYYVKGIG